MLCVGRYCEQELLVRSSSKQLAGGIIAAVVVAGVLAVLVLTLLLLLLCARSQRKHTGTYRPSNVEHKAGSLPLPTVAATSSSTTPLHLVASTKQEILV